MNKLIQIIFLFTCFNVAYGQQKIEIKGKVQDQIQIPLLDAAIIIGNSADSTQIASTATDEEGQFKLDIEALNKPFYIIVNDPL